MNWLLPAVLIFLLFMAWDGHRKGFIKKSVGMVSWILTFVLTSVTVPYITEFLKEKTALYRVLKKAIVSSDTDAMQILKMIGQENAAGDYAADLILQVVAFLITLMLVGALIQGIAFSLGIAAKLPILHGINKTAGMLLGLAEGMLAVWIFFFIITVCISTETGGRLLFMIADSEILLWIYRHNLLFAFLTV